MKNSMSCMASFVLRFSFVSELYGLCFVTVTSYICWIYDKADPGEGKALWISSDGDDRMGVKVKTQKKSIGFPTKPTKIPGPKINPPHLLPRKKKSHAKFPSLLDSNNTRNTKNFINNIMQNDNFILF